MVNTETLQKIKSLAHALRGEIISIRRYLHAHPELSFQEKETSSFISKKLSEWKIEHRTNIGGYGIVGMIRSRNQEPSFKTIALRADMDALPITEKNQL